MLTLAEEYERRTLKSKSRVDSKDAAFSASDKGGKQKSKCNVECYNCKKKGHYKADCWAPGGGKEGQGLKGKGKAKEKAAVAKADEKSEDAAWMAIAEANILDFIESAGGSSYADTADDGDSWFIDDDSNESLDPLFVEIPLVESATDYDDNSDSIPDLQTVSNSDTERGDEMSSQFDNKASVNGVEEAVTGDSNEAYTLTFEYAFLAKHTTGVVEVETELYDSGATRHMSPYRHRFVNFTPITPRPIGAADNRTFKAVGKGDMYINVPCGEKTSRVLLTDVLYAPEMGVTLVAISRITASGSMVVFRDDSCRIVFITQRTLRLP